MDPVIESIEAKEDEGKGSLDVLLQLTMPIVLILALLVTAWLVELKQAKEDMKASSIQRLNDELDYTILALKKQLLLVATDKVMSKEKEELKIASYTSTLPDVRDVWMGRVNDEFMYITDGLSDRFGDNERYDRYVGKLTDRVKEEYEVLVAEFKEGNEHISSARNRKLKYIKGEDEKYFLSKLKGEIGEIKSTAMAVQFKLALDWLKDEDISREFESSSDMTWKGLQEARNETSGQAEADIFYNLLVMELEKKLGSLDIHLIPEAVTELKQ